MTHSTSIIIIVKNDRGIADTLFSIKQQERLQSTEVIVVDASLPGVLEDIKEANPGVSWYQFTPRIADKSSIPEQRNFGVSRASGNIIVFIDANCIPVDGWLKKLTGPIARGAESITTGPFGSVDTSKRVVKVDEVGNVYLTCSGTGNLSFKKKVWEKVGGFDENFLYGSDVDFTWRCVDAGYQILFIPDAGVTHNWGTISEDVRRAFKYGKARADLLIKHPKRILTQLSGESAVIPIYTFWLLGLFTLTYIFPLYFLSIVTFIALFMVRNPHENPIRKILTTFTYVFGFYRNLFMRLIYG